MSKSSGITLEERQRICEPVEWVFDVVVVYEAVVDVDEVDICCWRGDGDTMFRCDTDDPLDRMDAGDVGDRT